MQFNKRLLFLMMIIAAAATAAERRHWFNSDAPLTRPSSEPADAIARQFLKTVSRELKLTPAELESVYLFKQYQTEHNGVNHRIYRQKYQDLDVHGAELTVNIASDGAVLNAGGLLAAAPAAGTIAPQPAGLMRSVRAAVGAVNARAATHFAAFQIKEQRGFRTTIAAGSLGADVEAEPVWFPVDDRLVPAYAVSVVDENGVNSYEIIVSSETQRILGRESRTFFQNAPRGMVFDKESPQPNPSPGSRLTAPPAFVDRTWQSFKGDTTASPLGWVGAGSTSGNNVIVGENVRGIQLFKDPKLAIATNGEFNFPLQLGPSAPNPSNYADAASANLFYWMNQAHDLFYALGFNEVAGNYQKENGNKGGVAGDAIYGYSHYGSQRDSLAATDNAFYTAANYNDGTQAMIAMYLGQSTNLGLFSDGSYDSQVIVHEYTHGVSLRLVRNLSGQQGNAMGEAWSDFFGLEFTLPEGAPADGIYPTASYLSLDFVNGSYRSRPFTTNMEINPLTYSDVGKVIGRAEAHADGEIWVEALWEIRANLIKQFGDKEGRRRVRVLVIDGMKMAPPAPTMIDARDAILLADRVDFKGASQQQLWDGFAKRGMGTLASSRTTATSTAIASFESLSPAAKLAFSRKQFTAGTPVTLYLVDSKVTKATAEVTLTTFSGDLETVTLARTGNYFSKAINTTNGAAFASKEDGRLQLIPGDSVTAYYDDAEGTGGLKQISLSVPTVQPFTTGYAANTALQFPDETPLFALRDFLSSITGLVVPLPFAFPFFGESFKSVTLYGGGFLDFGNSGSHICANNASLLQIKGVAGLFADIDVLGSAQPNENVYFSTTPTSATFRWVAETSYPIAGNRADPVNLAITLHTDGRIDSRYGTGNKNLSSYDATCGGTLPLVGISDGSSTYGLLAAQFLGAVSLENALSVRFTPGINATSIPQVVLEAPGDNNTKIVQNMTVTGVAWDTDSPITRINVLVDGKSVGGTTTGLSRADFCANKNVTGCPRVGFSTVVDLLARGVEAGRHRMQLSVANSRGAIVVFPETPFEFDLEFPPPPPPSTKPTLMLESPTDGATIAGTSIFKGYALAGSSAISGIDVLIDGITWGRAIAGGSANARLDICTSVTLASNCPNVGFTYTFNAATGFGISSGAHTVQIRARDIAGNLYLYPEVPQTFTLDKPGNQAPVVVLNTPRANEKLRDIVKVSGSAYDPDGRVVSVQIVIDNAKAFTAIYGTASPEACEMLKDVAACPNIGFEYNLDTRLLSNGVHSLQVFVKDDRGTTTSAPAIINNGMNIIVEN